MPTFSIIIILLVLLGLPLGWPSKNFENYIDCLICMLSSLNCTFYSVTQCELIVVLHITLMNNITNSKWNARIIDIVYYTDSRDRRSCFIEHTTVYTQHYNYREVMFHPSLIIQFKLLENNSTH